MSSAPGYETEEDRVRWTTILECIDPDFLEGVANLPTEEFFTAIQVREEKAVAFNEASQGMELFNNFGLNWSLKGVGFGQLYFSQGEDGTIVCDNECMSKELVKEILCKLVDVCQLKE